MTVALPEPRFCCQPAAPADVNSGVQQESVMSSLSRREFGGLATGAVLAGTVGSPELGGVMPAFAQTGAAGKEPIGGQPAPGQRPSVPDLEYQVMYQRAFETVLWSLPAVEIYRFRAGALENFDMTDNDIIANSGTATPKIETLTANSSTPYIAAYCDLRKGPAVLEVPEAGANGSLYGQVVDAWQFTIADVGPSGLDQGKASKYLFTPPGYNGKIPDGYIHVASPHFRIAFAFRSVRAPGKTEADAYAYAKKLRMYYLSQAENPPTQKFLDFVDVVYPTLAFFDERYFADVHAIFSVEPIADKDKIMVGNLRSLGIERGKPYAPTEKQRRAMRAAIVDAYFYMDRMWEEVDPQYYFWKDRNYVKAQFTDRNRRFTYEYEDSIDIDGRAAAFFPCTYMPKEITETPANWYIVAMGTGDKKPFEAGKTYRVKVPAEMPVKQFWALTVYDRATFAFIYTASGRTTLSTYDLNSMTKEPDGSVYLYVGPEAPKGLEANWIPTRGKCPYPLFRFYGATDALNNRSFKMPDFELVKL